MTESPLSSPIAAFRPVGMARQRHDGWSAARQELFIIRLEQLGIVTTAARAVGMSPKSAYALLNRSLETQEPDDSGVPTFAQAWDAAIEMGRDHAAELAIDRAINGQSTPVFFRGRQVGERRIYNDAC